MRGSDIQFLVRASIEREMVSMCRARLLLTSVVVALSVFAGVVSSASAALNFEWLVAGNSLKSGETKEFLAVNDGTAFIKARVATLSTELSSTHVRFLPGAKIIGGKPGKNEETVVFENVEVLKPEKCEVKGKTIQTQPLETEIVEAANGKKVATGEPLILFRPKTGTVFAEFTIQDKGTETCNVATTVTAEGTVLGLPLPAKPNDSLTQSVDFEAIGKEYRNSAGALTTAFITFAKNQASVTGLALITLESDQLFGIF